MTPEFWSEAEVFYETTLIAIGLVLFFFVFVYFMMWTYRTEKNKRFMWLPVIGIVLTAGAGIMGQLRYEPYLEQATVLNPLVRDRKRHFLGYAFYSPSEQEDFRKLNDREALSRSILYEETLVEEAVDYLGEENAVHYFKTKDGELFKYTGINIVFQDNVQEARLLGSQFALEDAGFKDIGFKDPEYVMFESFIVPKSEEQRPYDAGFSLDIPDTAQVFRGWTF